MQENDDGGDGESKQARVNRELIELLNELRVVLPGVQVLFAFLLVVPFSNGFPGMTLLQRDTYFAAFLATAASSALLIAPSAYHRLHFRSKDKERMLFTSNRLAVAGTVSLALAIGLVAFLVTDVLFKAAAASIVTAATAGWFGWFWYGLPLSRKRREGTG
jgi:hypothetical protein